MSSTPSAAAFFEPKQRTIRVEDNFDFVMEILRLKKDKRERLKEIECLKAEVNTLNETQQEYISLYNTVTDEVEHERRQVAKLKQKLASLEAENHRICMEVSGLQHLRTEKERVNELYLSQQSKLASVMSDLETRNDFLEAQYQGLASETGELAKANSSLQQELQACHYQLTEANEQEQVFEETFQQNSVLKKQVTKLMQLLEEKNRAESLIEEVEPVVQKTLQFTEAAVPETPQTVGSYLSENTTPPTAGLLEEDSSETNSPDASELMLLSPAEQLLTKTTLSDRPGKFDHEQLLMTPMLSDEDPPAKSATSESTDGFQRKPRSLRQVRFSDELQKIAAATDHSTEIDFEAERLRRETIAKAERDSMGTDLAENEVGEYLLGGQSSHEGFKTFVKTRNELGSPKHVPTFQSQHYTKFMEQVMAQNSSGDEQSLQLMNLMTLNRHLLANTYYKLLKVPQEVADEQSWADLLQEGYDRFRNRSSPKDHPSLADKKSIGEGFYVMSRKHLKTEYDVALKTIHMLKTGFHAVLTTVTLKTRKGWFGSPSSKGEREKQEVSLSFANKYFIADFGGMRLFTLNRRMELQAIKKQKLHLNKHTFIDLSQILETCPAHESFLNPAAVRIMNKDLTPEKAEDIVQLVLKSKTSKKSAQKEEQVKCFIDVNNKELCQELSMTLRLLQACSLVGVPRGN